MKKFIKIMKFIEKHMLAVLIGAIALIIFYAHISLVVDVNPGPEGLSFLYPLFVALVPTALWVIAGFAWMIIYNFLPESVTQAAEAEE